MKLKSSVREKQQWNSSHFILFFDILRNLLHRCYLALICGALKRQNATDVCVDIMFNVSAPC